MNTLDSLDLDLFDYPLDKNVIQEGEYWPDAYVGLGQNEFPWLYTVVDAGFQFPAGITHEILESEYIPDDDGPLEDLAFEMTGNEECPNNIDPSTPECPDGYHWDFNLGTCVENNTCPPGYHWDSNIPGCVPDPSTPLRPHGMINFKTYDDYGVVPPTAPLRYTRIEGRRFLKIDKTYTDANGNFQFSKRFPRRVTIVVKFRTSYVTITKTKRFLSPVKKNIGTYRGNDLQNLNYTFERSTSLSKKMRTQRWIAAIALNTVHEAKTFLALNNLTPLQNNFYIWLARGGDQTDQETPQYEFIKKSRPIDHGRYDIFLQWRNGWVNSMSASKVTINVAQQLGIQYLAKVNDASQDGINRFNDYWLLTYDWNYGYFGDGHVHSYDLSYRPELIAMWQAFAQHFGHTIANQFFGWGETSFEQQGKTWTSTISLSSSEKYLEEFDPSIVGPADYLHWIPVGLINDLMDNNSDPNPIIDNVSGFTYLDIQNAYYTEPLTMLDFKNALKAIKPTQSTAIDQLFTSYGY